MAWKDLQQWVKSANPGDMDTDSAIYTTPGTTPAAGFYLSGVSESTGSGNFLYSDNPEYVSVTGQGLAYMNVAAAGTFSVGLYHESAIDAHHPVNIQVAIRNVGTSPVIVECTQSAVNYSGNDGNPPPSGKGCVVDWYAGGNVVSPPAQTIAANGGVWTINVAPAPLAYQVVVNAMYTFTTTGPVKVYVVSGPISNYANITFAPLKHLIRGTGTQWERMVMPSQTFDPSNLNESNKARLSYNALNWQSLIDETGAGGGGVFNGEFNIDHLMVIPVSNSSASSASFGVVVNPRGGSYGGAAVVGGTEVTLPTGASTVLVPPGSSGALVARFTIGANLAEDFVFNWMMPGGGNTPIDFILVPYS